MSSPRKIVLVLSVALLLATSAAFAAPAAAAARPMAQGVSLWDASVARLGALLESVLPGAFQRPLKLRPQMTTQCDNTGAMDPNGHCKP